MKGDHPADEEPNAFGSDIDATDMGDLVVGLCQDVLEVDAVVLSDDFFSLGGDSLQAMHFAARLSAALGTRVPVRMLFKHPHLDELAEQLRAGSALSPRDDASRTAASGTDDGLLAQIRDLANDASDESRRR